jgi:ABC-2 type transport system permease protein
MTLGQAAEAALSEGVSFSGITLAVAAPEGDSTPALLEKLLPKLEGIDEYCRVAAMDREEAVTGLESGEVTAVLVLPENMIQGIMNGTNPDVQLIVPGDMPLEALLTLCVGESASDLLAAVQSGVYAVLEQYSRTPAEEVIFSSNIRTRGCRRGICSGVKR